MQRPEYDVVISGADNGIIVKIGCKTLIFKETEMGEFMADLSTFITGGYRGYQELRKKYYAEEMASETKCDSAQDVPPPLRTNC